MSEAEDIGFGIYQARQKEREYESVCYKHDEPKHGCAYCGKQPAQQQEPFGYLWPTGMHPEFRYTQQKRDGVDGMPVYTFPPAQQQEPEYKGWYCAHCQRGVDGSEVTYHEQHTVCGRVITDDLPPSWDSFFGNAEQPANVATVNTSEELVDKTAENVHEQPAQDNTYSYAKNLAEAIFKQHFASDEHYASGQIVWGVNDTVIGILTQIDNMVTDMVRRPAQQEPVASEHITDGRPCWCEPETNYKDPETGISVIVHKEPQ